MVRDEGGREEEVILLHIDGGRSGRRNTRVR